MDWEREYVTCKRRKAKQAEKIMAPLPTIHLRPSLRAFRPFITKQGRGKARCKRY